MHLDVMHVFRQAAVNVLDSYGFSGIRSHEVRVFGDTFARTGAAGVSLALSGALCGSVGFAVPRGSLAAFAGRVMGASVEPPSFAEQCEVLCELANIMGGHAMGQLYAMGFGVDMSIPTLSRGPEVLWCFAPAADAVLFPVDSDQGLLEVVLSVNPG